MQNISCRIVIFQNVSSLWIFFFLTRVLKNLSHLWRFSEKHVLEITALQFFKFMFGQDPWQTYVKKSVLIKLQDCYFWKRSYLLLAVTTVKMPCISSYIFSWFSDKDKTKAATGCVLDVPLDVFQQKQPLDVFQQKMCSWKYSKFSWKYSILFRKIAAKTCIQNHSKIFLKKLIFSNIATTVLKNELFTGVIQGFWLQLLDHLFCGVALIGCFILKSFFVKLVAFEVTAKQFSKNSCSEICDQNHQKIHVNKFIFSKARSPQLFQ